MVALTHPDLAENFEEGMRFVANKDYTRAAELFKKIAEQGHAEAQFYLGLMCEGGQGVTKDEQQAVSWWAKAAEQGHVLAQNNLGLMYEQGLGVTQDYQKAASWFRMAAEQGDAEAQYTLGFMYANGEGVPRSYQQAMFWLSKAAEQGDVAAQFKVAKLYLGSIYSPDNDVKQDFIEAYKWFRIAGVDGDENAKDGLEIAESYLTPSAVEEAQRRVDEWLAIRSNNK